MIKKYKQTLLPIAVSILILTLTSLLYLGAFTPAKPLIQRLNALTYDMRVRVSPKAKPSEFTPIYIVDIDEASLGQEGQWPWSRHKLASLIEILHQAGTAVITLDITFAEPEKNPVDAVVNALEQKTAETIQALDEIRDKLDGDQHLASIMSDKGVILGYLFHPMQSLVSGQIKATKINTDKPLEQLSSLTMQGYTANLPILIEAASQNGFFTIRPDDDGIVRKAALVLEHNKQLYSSLAVEAAKLYMGADQEALQLKSETIGKVQTITQAVLAGQHIRTDATGQILIPYLGPANTFPYISATDVLNKRPIPDLTDAIVIIGTSALALADLRTTPLQTSYPGVEIQATLIHALLNPEQIPYTPEWQDGATIALLALLTLFMMLLFPMLRPLALIVTGFILMLSVIGFNFWLWIVPRINLDLILPLLLIIAISTTFILHRLLGEHKERQRIHDMFGQYVPVGHIDRMLTDSSDINMDGERREMSVLFSDIRSFTAISEHLTTQQLKQFLNVYLTPITAIIFNRQGTIDKYIGDLVMAFWGAPLDDPKHAENAVLAALAMREKTEAMQNEFLEIGIKQTVSAGIGIHTGEMNVGDMGSTYRRAYTVLGDAVNLGSRLESLTKQYGISILVSEDTMKQCPSVCFREIDYIRVKGRQKPVRVYEPMCLLDSLTLELKQCIVSHEEALNEYQSGNWQLASQLFTTLLERADNPLQHVYLKRMGSSDFQSPPDWDGVYTHTSK